MLNGGEKMPKDQEYPNNALSPFSPELDAIKRGENDMVSSASQTKSEKNSDFDKHMVNRQSPFY